MQVERQGTIKHETYAFVRSYLGYDLFPKVQREVERKAV